MQQILELDVGNTRTKWRLLAPTTEAGSLVPLAGDVTLDTLLQRSLADVCQCRVSVVGDYDEVFLRSRLGIHCAYIRAKTLMNYRGLKNSYTEINRMGVDRWLAMMAIWSKKPGPSILVDVGTAFKVEIIQSDGLHLGGYILPGIEMQRRALLQGTAQIDYRASAMHRAYAADDGCNQAALMPGSSTETCIDQGIRLSQVATIEKILTHYPKHTLWITGGGGRALARLLDKPCVYEADLVLDGLSLYADYLGESS